jgi:hypothetical protein
LAEYEKIKVRCPRTGRIEERNPNKKSLPLWGKQPCETV